MLVELLALNLTRRTDTVPGDISHKTPLRAKTVLKRSRMKVKRKDGGWPLD